MMGLNVLAAAAVVLASIVGAVAAPLGPTREVTLQNELVPVQAHEWPRERAGNREGRDARRAAADRRHGYRLEQQRIEAERRGGRRTGVRQDRRLAQAPPQHRRGAQRAQRRPLAHQQRQARRRELAQRQRQARQRAAQERRARQHRRAQRRDRRWLYDSRYRPPTWGLRDRDPRYYDRSYRPGGPYPTWGSRR